MKHLETNRLLSISKTLSFRKVVPVALFSMIFVLAVRQCVSLDPDLWWHLKTGEQIVTTKAIPHVDDYSFTKRGSEWVAHEWLSEVLIYGTYKVVGLTGLVVIFSIVIVAALLIVYFRCDGRPYAASIAVLMMAATSSPLFGIRPQMITLLLASIYVALLDHYIESGQKRLLWWLPPLMLCWVNLHAGFALGLGLIGLFLIRAILDYRWDRLPPLASVLLVCTALVPINPNGFRMFSYPYETLTSPSMAALIQEWASPDFHRVTYLPLAVLLLATFGISTISPVRISAGKVSILLITAFGALRSVRHIPIFALFAAPAFASQLWTIVRARGWDRWFTLQEPQPNAVKLLINVLLLLAVGVLGVSRVVHFAKHEREYEGIRNPVAAVNFLQANNLPGPIYNRYGWGGYLIYRLYPSYRVYIDGRADVYGDDFFAETMDVYDGTGKWEETLDRSGVNTVIVSPEANLTALLRRETSWNIVYEDNKSIIFCRTNIK